MATDGGESYKARRKLVIETAAEVFKEKGYEAASINDIAQKLSTDRASIYYYAASKEELFIEIVNVVLDENLKVANAIAKRKGNPRERLTALIEEMISSYDRNYPFMYVFIQDMPRIALDDAPWVKVAIDKTRQFESTVTKILRQGQASGIFRKDIPLELTEMGLFGMVNWTHRWYKPGGKAAPSDIAKAFAAVFFDGVSVPEKSA
jgi:TetR/AcrR family transcriptional regulator, cholesterol catabolism regulator